MTWIEKEVPSLELCKRLKELGFPQGGSGLYWSRWYVNEPFRVIFSPDGEKFCGWVGEDYVEYQPPIEKYKAPTCREIIERIDTTDQKYVTSDRLAKDLIWLVENEYMEFREGR